MNSLNKTTAKKGNDLNLTFTWRTWYWWFSFFANALTVVFLMIYMIIMDRLSPDLLDSILYPLYIAFSTMITLLLTITYFLIAYKDYQINREIVKKKRIKNLHNGLLINSIAQIFYFLAVIVSYNVYKFQNANISSTAKDLIFPGNISTIAFLGIMFAFMALILTVGFIYWTFYQFSFAFDLFVFRNKDKILESNKKFSKNFITQNTKLNWVELAQKHKAISFQNGINKWTNYVDIYHRLDKKKK